MNKPLKLSQIRQLRLRSQALSQRTGTSPGEIVRHMVGVQAQDSMAAKLAIGARARALSVAQVNHALEGSHTLVRTWSLRGTLHLHAPEDLGWLLPLVGPLHIRRTRRRFAELGLNDEIYARARPVLEALLAAEGPLTRGAVAGRLAGQGIPTAGQAAYHLLRRAGLEGLVCYGPDVDGEPAFVLLKDWVQVHDPWDEEAAPVHLAHRYLSAYGPAQPGDLAAWSGLTLPTARQGFAGLAGKLERVTLAGEEAWLLAEHAAQFSEVPAQESTVRLLPGYDPYLLGYRQRAWMVAPAYARRIHPGGGTLRATLLVNGLAAGLWRRRDRTHDLVVRVEPFEELQPDALSALEAEVEALGGFLEAETVLELGDPEG